jgi:hypothetical protein
MSQAVLNLTLSHFPPGAGVAAQVALAITSNYVAAEGGTLDIPNGTLSGVEFDLPFGTVDTDGLMFVFKNTNNQDMMLRLNGSANLTRVAPGGMVMIGHPTAVSGGVPTPLLAASVLTTAPQVGAGTVNYYVFGS